MLQDEADAFQGEVHVFFVRLGVADDAFDAVAEGVHGAGGGDLLRGVDGEFAIQHDVGDVQADQDGGAFDALLVHHHGADGHLGAGAGGGRDVDDGQRTARDRQELQQEHFRRDVGHFHAGGDHLGGVHHGAAAEGDDGFGAGVEGLFAAGFDVGDGGFGVDVGVGGEADPGGLQGVLDGPGVAELAEDAVGDQQDLFVAAGAADFADLAAGAVAFCDLGFGERDGVDDFAGDAVDGLAEVIGFHGSLGVNWAIWASRR